MKSALSQSGLHPNQVDYVHAHATSTPLGDVIEANAIKKCILRTCNIGCFGPILHKDNFWFFKQIRRTGGNHVFMGLRVEEDCCPSSVAGSQSTIVSTQTSVVGSNGVDRSRKGAGAGVGKGRAGSGVGKS
ncbi:hypothetical protein RGQ29_004139 [Quercus rubra]|uniref:beta-ketoacyl-[acyl-carrier-protein] synthase I n=1 Tax=Quercus rubra TaxID=3512 RepID=A0AAN7EDS8_QUERU|nr:hypothetical protein RGQ29_004139 [Quercus rubra]